MTAPSVIRSGVGLRDFQIMVLDANGYPAATSTAAYAGIDVSGVRDATINDPEPRLIQHYGDDRIFAVDSLPPTEPLTGELRVSKINDTVDEALTGNKSFTVGEAKLFGVSTDLKGNENQVAVIIFQQALDTDPAGNFGARVWNFKIAPKAQLIPRESGMGDAETEQMYTFRPQYVSKHLWGTAFSASTEGFTQAQLIRGVAANKPRIVAFKADGTTTTFTLGDTATSTAKVAVWNAGVLTTAGITVNTTSVVFTTAPTANNMIVTFFEVANTSGDAA